MGSAEVAKSRLERISLADWTDRVEAMLEVAGLRLTDFPDIPWDRYYNARMAPGRVADIIVGVAREVKRQRN